MQVEQAGTGRIGVFGIRLPCQPETDVVLGLKDPADVFINRRPVIPEPAQQSRRLAVQHPLHRICPRFLSGAVRHPVFGDRFGAMIGRGNPRRGRPAIPPP